MRPSVPARVVAAASTLLLLPVVAHAAVQQNKVTSQNAVTYTPQLVRSGVDRPRIDALAVTGSRTYAGGRFETVSQGGRDYARLRNLMAFSTGTGAVDATFRPQFDARVSALEAAPGGGVYVGGRFSHVNGAARGPLVKLTAAGSVDKSFKPPFGTGAVNDLEIATIRGERRLVVAGGMKGKLVSLNLDTGANTGQLDAAFTEKIPGARGSGTSVFSVAVSAAKNRLIATGNFMTVTVDGVSRARRAFVMLDLPTASADTAIDPWYYPGFGKECSATTVGDARRIANLQGVDWSPSGNHFVVAATGKVPKPGDVWHKNDTAARNAGSTVCDAVGRFALGNPTQAVWINYSGGDSLWTVQDTGAAVYVQGHMKWLDNADGFGSHPAVCTKRDADGICIAGIGDTVNNTPASRRVGVGAINPVTGRAFAGWDPFSASQKGGKALVATQSGVWWGSDSRKWNGKRRYGLAFTPTPR